MVLSLELKDTFSMQFLSTQISCMLPSFYASFSRNSMPRSSCSALHRLNPNLNKIHSKSELRCSCKIFCYKKTFVDYSANYISRFKKTNVILVFPMEYY